MAEGATAASSQPGAGAGGGLVPLFLPSRGFNVLVFCRGVLSFRDISRFVVGVCLMAMRSIPRKIEQTPEQLAARIKEREAEAAKMAPGPARRSLLREISQLRACEEEKRWLRSSAPGA